MADVELIIKGDSSQYVKAVKDAQKADQELYTNAEKGSKRQKGLIQDIEDEMKKLEDAKKKAWKIEDIEKYNRKLAEAKKDLKEYETAGINANKKVEDSGNSLLKSIGKWAAGFFTVATAVKGLKAIIASTETTSHAFERVIAGATSGLGYFFKTIASGDWSNFFEGLRKSIEGAAEFVDKMEELTNKSNEQLIRSAEYDKKISDLRADTFDRDDENNEKRKSALTEIVALQKQKFTEEAKLLRDTYEANLKKAASDSGLAEEQIENFLKEFSSLEELIKAGEEYNEITKLMRKPGLSAEYVKKLMEERNALKGNASEAGKYVMQIGKVLPDVRKQLSTYLADAIHKEAQFNATNRRDKMQLDAVDKEIKKNEETRLKESLEKKLKAQDEYQKLSLKLLEDYDKSNIESLSGVERLKAEREFGIKQIKEIRDRLTELGTITPEQMAMLEAMGNNVWKAYYKGVAEEAKRVTPKQQEEITKALLGDIPELPGLQKMTQNTVENIQKKLEENKATEEFSIWKLMGIDPESDEGGKQVEAIQEMASKLKDALDSTFQMRVDNAERQRELLDTQISELQNEIDLEAELMEEGFANNLTAKQKELDELKKQREKALAEEEKALKQQQSFDRISQAISLATSVANILKSFTKLGPLGLVLAAGAVASLWAIWAGAKAKAAQTSKLAEGGSGTEKGLITGRRHYQGGERFLDHIEVERGEAFGVLSRGATEKYGNIFHNMVSSFNKDAMPDFIAPAVSNSIKVENNGPNSRLDKVIKEQQRLNESLTKQSQLYSTGNKRIIKNGNKIRIIG